MRVALPLPGQLFGRFRIERQLGRGGMGAVFEATDTVLERAVAVKIMLPEIAADEAFRARFLREAAVLARLKSPHIVQIYDSGEQDGTVYLVTELFSDGDLQLYLRAHGAMAPIDALALLKQIAEGLRDAHEAGIVHRDIKPSNVLIWKRDGKLLPYLCDFGIAADGDSTLTQAGAIIGSFGFMAPERHHGAPADERSDIYALGCLLCCLVTGKPPYGGTDFQIMTAHVNDPIPQLELGPDASEEVNALLRSLMAKDPAARPGSVDRVIDRMASAGQSGGDRTVLRLTPPDADTTLEVTSHIGGSRPMVKGSGRRRRRGVLLVVGTVVVAVGATAHLLLRPSDPDGSPSGPRTAALTVDPCDVPSGPASESVEVSGRLGVPPTVTVPSSLTVDGDPLRAIERSVVARGKGPTTQGSDAIEVSISLFGGEGEFVSVDHLLAVPNSAIPDVLRASFVCVPVGSRTVTVLPSSALFSGSRESEEFLAAFEVDQRAARSSKANVVVVADVFSTMAQG